MERRAKELGITFVQQGVDSKASALDQIIDNGFPAADLCAIDDDLRDLELFNHDAVSLAATVANAHPAVLDRAQHVKHGQASGSQKLAASLRISIEIITGRQSNIVARMPKELGINFLQQGVNSKTSAL